MPHHQSNDEHEIQEGTGGEEKGGHGRWLMLACCVPIVAAVALLIAIGGMSVGFAVIALGCVAAMGGMMFVMARY